MNVFNANKSRCNYVYHIMKRFMSELHEITSTKELLSSYLGLNQSTSTAFSRKHNLNKVDINQLKDVVKFCESLNVSKSDLLNYPQLMKLHPQTLDNRYLALKESGFSYVDADILARFRNLSNQSIKALKDADYIPAKINVPEKLISYLKPQPDKIDISDLTEDTKWSYVHIQIIKRYLMWRLDASKEEIERLFRVYKMIKLKSLQYLCENIAIALDLKFTPPRKLLKYGYLLHMYPQYPKTILSLMPNLAGGDLRVYMRRYPKLTMVSPRNYIEIYKMLKDANIPDSTILKSMNIFHVSPETVGYRLREITSVPEFKIHLHNPSVLRLIVHYNRAKYRLTFLQAVKLRCASFYVIGSDGDAFDKFVREGVDINVKSEVISFIKHLLKSNNDDIETNLKKHPFYRNIPLQQIKNTFDYLESKQFNADAILSAVQILLYPKSKVNDAFERIMKDKRIRKMNIEDHQKLNLMLYYMEKEYHFTGNGITDSFD